MAKLRPFRDYSEHDVINLFAYNGTSLTRGAIVKLDSTTGWKADQNFSTESMIANLGISNAVSERHALASRVALSDSGDATVLGMALYDVAEVDENGEKLIFNPRKAHEMQTVVSGQAVPVVTDGMFLVNGVTNPTLALAGVKAYSLDDGAIGALPVGEEGTAVSIGKFLGGTAANGDVLLKLEL
jgi:hypothetical protein